MMAIFQDKGWIAEPATRLHHESLFEFVELLDHTLDHAIPYKAYKELQPSEGLKLFYDHLEETHNRLQRSLTEHQTIYCRLLACARSARRRILTNFSKSK
jgi:hypothetical protein